MTGPIDQVTDPAYLADLGDADLDAVRAKRQECQDLENALSYVRRLVHGRLDIVRSELESRRAGAEPADLDSIIARLPELFSDGARSDALPRPPQDLSPGGIADDLATELEDVFPATAIGSLPDCTVDELSALTERLSDFERGVSGGRSALHEVIDRLHDEIVRRYKAGDANVDSLLT